MSPSQSKANGTPGDTWRMADNTDAALFFITFAIIFPAEDAHASLLAGANRWVTA
jgi:hypothetical protein